MLMALDSYLLVAQSFNLSQKIEHWQNDRNPFNLLTLLLVAAERASDPKKSGDEVLAWLSVGREVQMICIWFCLSGTSLPMSSWKSGC